MAGTVASASAFCPASSITRTNLRHSSLISSSLSPFHTHSPLLLPSIRPSTPKFTSLPRSMANDTIFEEKLGVRVERNPPESRLSELGVRSWPKWGCPPSKFPWTYSGTETCYLLKGKVKVYGENSSEYIEIGAGDLVVFPDGMSCTWDVSETVDKHYSFS